MASSVFPSPPVQVATTGALTGTGTSASKLAVSVDGTTIEVNGSNQLEASGAVVASKVGVGFFNPALIAAVAPYLVPGRDVNIGAQSADDSLYGANLVLQSGDAQSAPSIFAFQSGGTTTTPTAIVSGDDLLAYIPYAYDGTAFVLAGHFELQVNGTVATGIIPTRLRITMVDNAGVSHVSIFDRDGGLAVAGSVSPAKGVIFPASDPHVVGAWWDNAGTLTRSAG